MFTTWIAHSGAGAAVQVFLVLFALLGTWICSLHYQDRNTKIRLAYYRANPWADEDRKQEPPTYYRVGYRTVVFLLAGLPAALVLNLSLSMLTPLQGDDTPTMAEIAQQVGLQSDHVYPLSQGNIVSGASGTITVSRYYLQTTITPESAITAHFPWQGGSVDLTIPTDKIKYMPGPAGSSPTITFIITGDGSAEGTIYSHYSRCKWMVVNFMPSCIRVLAEREVDIYDDVKDQGPAQLLKQHPDALQKVVITLPPDLYAKATGS